MVYISGQMPKTADGLIGKLGGGFSIEDAQKAARVAINLIAQMKKAADGDLDRVRVLKLNGFVNATQDFEEHPAVVNGASDLMVEVFGERGRHPAPPSARLHCRSKSRSRLRRSSRSTEPWRWTPGF